jgi:adenine-specific DNA-methyltransferase
MTPAEAILWKYLRDRRFEKFKVRRQHPIGPYIVDFYCPAACLVVELDGETHVGREVADETRQQWLEAQGVRVLRFWNHEIYDDLQTVLEAIWRACDTRGSAPLTPDPSPRNAGRGGGKSRLTVAEFF